MTTNALNDRLSGPIRLHAAGLLIVLAGLVLGGTAAMGMFAPLPRERRVVRYEIPVGTADSLARGENPDIVPARLAFVIGRRDILIVENQDNASHSFGPWFVPPGQTIEVQFTRPAHYQANCSLHPENQLVIDIVKPLPFSLFWRN